MTIQALGSLGVMIIVVATVVTNFYFAIQSKQNTRGLRSQTFQQSSMGISLNSNAKSSDCEPAIIVVNAPNNLDNLSSEERIRFHYWLVVAFRNFEAIFVQGIYGYIDFIRTEGYERFIIKLISYCGPAEWWSYSKLPLAPPL